MKHQFSGLHFNLQLATILHTDFCFSLSPPTSASQVDSPRISRATTEYGSDGESEVISAVAAIEPLIFWKS